MKKIFRKNNKLTVILRSEASSGSYQPLDITQNWSDSEHTQSLQTHNNGRFRMTKNRHTKAFSGRHPEALAEGSIKDSSHSLRMTQNSSLSLGEGWGEGCHWQKALKTATLTLAMSFFITQSAMATESTLQTGNSMPKTNRIEYGHKDAQGAVPYYFKWSNTSTGTTLEQAAANEADIIYWADPSRVADDNFEIIEGEDINKDFIHSANGINNNIYAGIGNITGDFIGNQIINHSESSIYNGSWGRIKDITGNFIGNSGSGAIFNYMSARIENITADFIGNYSKTSGGAIYSEGQIANIKGNFIGNFATVSGGAIYNCYGTSGSASINDITANFNANWVSGQKASGGAIYNGAPIADITGDFIGNYAKTESDLQLALGGAVYTRYDMNFIADNQTNYFSGNYTEDYRGKINNAIFVETEEYSSPTIKLQAQNNGVIIFDDQIDGGKSVENDETGKYEIDRTNAYNLALDGDNTGDIYLNNEVINANISIDNTNVYVNEGTNLAQSRSLAVNSGVLNIQHLNNQTVNFEQFSNKSQINLASVDVDLAKESMGRITADKYAETTGKINVQGLNLLSDATKDVTNVLFADEEIASSVSYTGVSPVAYSPIWKYDVSYNPDDGFFSFVRGAASSDNASDAFNPSVLASPVATQAGAYTTQLQTFNYAFQHVDTFMNIPYLERVAMINQGKYALSPTGDATDVGTYSPLLLKEESAGFWVKPYASFENVPLKNGPKVSNINYGTLVGYDSPLQSISNGFERVLTGYIGYNGASQRYSGVDAYQNGGLLGGTATFYKGNFFNATTLSVGASAGDASTMYGSENYTMLLAGLGNKTGYNFEFFDGGMILQPSMLISYTFVNTFDYTNGAGVRIESDPMHAIQLAPGIKLIGNTKNGWQPYIGVSMVWNLLDESKVTADSVRLPEMSIKPYVQYGVGLQKRVNDKFLAFGQAMIHNGGRNGVSLSAGLRWKIGRE